MTNKQITKQNKLSKIKKSFPRLRPCFAGGIGVLMAASAVSRAAAVDKSDALLDALIRKGVLTEKEAEDVRDETTTNITAMAASKWKIDNAIQSIGLFGDVRFRYEYRGVDDSTAPLSNGSTYYRERFRYALRAGIRGDLFDHFNYGIRIETSANPRSPWVTFADDTGKTSSGGISQSTPSDKTSDFLNVGQVYLGWHPCETFQITVGRMPMPLYTTPMVWDSDINPEGAFEKFTLPVRNAELFADFGQFDYQNVTPASGAFSGDTFILAWQLGANVKFSTNSSFKIAPVVYNYAGAGTSSANLNSAFVGQGYPASNALAGQNINGLQNGIDDLLILEVPAEYNLRLGKYHLRSFGDFSYNFLGDDRARSAFAAGAPHGYFPGVKQAVTGQNIAYQVGVGIGNEGPVYGPTQGLVYGSTSKQNTWEARVYWQHIEQYALDANLIDSDFFEGRCNLQGIYAAFCYSFTDGILGTVRYGYANRINGKLGTGGSNLDIPVINPIQNYNLVQLDLTWRF